MINATKIELNDEKGDKAGASVTYKTDKGDVKVTFGYEKEVEDMGRGINPQYPKLEKTYTRLVINVYKNGEEAYKENPLVASEYNDPDFSKQGKVDLLENLQDYRHSRMVFCASEYEPEPRSPYDEIIAHAGIDVEKQLEEKQNKNQNYTTQQIQSAMKRESR